MNIGSLELDYFESYEHLEQEFKVSTCATLSRNKPSIDLARKFLDENYSKVASKTEGRENPYILYKEVLSPYLWENFEIASLIMHYIDCSEIPDIDPILLNMARKVCKTLDNEYKMNGSKLNHSSFGVQVNKVMSSAKKYLNKHNGIDYFNREIENLIMTMVIYRTYTPPAKFLSTSPGGFHSITECLYRSVHYYRNSVSIKEYNQLRNTATSQFYKDEINEFRKLIGLGNLKKEGNKFSTLEATLQVEVMGEYDYYDHIINDLDSPLKKFFAKGKLSPKTISETWKNIFINSEPDGFEVELNSGNNEVMIATINRYKQSSMGIEICETDDTVFSLYEFNSAMGYLLMRCSFHPMTLEMFCCELYLAIRSRVILRDLVDTLKKATKPQVTIDYTQEIINKHKDELKELKRELQEANMSLSSKITLEEEVESLKRENLRLKKELESRSSNDKELNSLRNLAYQIERESSQNDKYNEGEISIEDKLSVINSNRIMVIGGYPGWVNKLKTYLPEAEFHDADSQNRKLDTKLSKGEWLVLYVTALNSHGVDYKVMPAIEKNEKASLVMITSHLNMNRLVNMVYESINK